MRVWGPTLGSGDIQNQAYEGGAGARLGKTTGECNCWQQGPWRSWWWGKPPQGQEPHE